MKRFILIVPLTMSLTAQAIELKLVRSGVLTKLDAITSVNREYSISVDWDMVEIGSLLPKKIFFKKDGKCLWEKENPLYISYFISDEGDVIGYIPWDEAGSRGELGFFNRDGNIICRVTVEYFTEGSFSPDGSLFGAQTTHGLLIFDSKGEEIWRLGKYRKFNISTNGERIVSVYENLIHFYQSGKLICERKIDTPFIKDLMLSLKGDRVALIAKSSVWIFDTRQGNLIWEKEIHSPETYVSLGRLDGEGFCFLIGKYNKVGDKMLGEGRAEIVRDSMVIAHAEINWGEGIPKFYSKGDTLFLRTREKEWEFKIIE